MAQLNYFIDDICDFLEAQGFTNVNAEYSESVPRGQISVTSTPGGSLAPGQFIGSVFFQIITTDQSRKQALKTARAVQVSLQNKKGYITATGVPVWFGGIFAQSTEPTFFGLNKNRASEFIQIYYSNIKRPDLTSTLKPVGL